MNFKHICGNTYLIKNQNGFNNAIYDFMDAENNEKESIRKAVQNFPTKYPTIISIYSQMFECSRIHIDITEPTKIFYFLIRIYFKLFS
jgi:hypothetical protein